MFDGKYHGHLDEALVELVDGALAPEEAGLPRDVADRTVLVPFNDPPALRAALAGGDIALVLTEPALTNNVGLLHARRRASTTSSGRPPAKPAPCSPTTRRTPRWWARAASPAGGTSSPTS